MKMFLSGTKVKELKGKRSALPSLIIVRSLRLAGMGIRRKISSAAIAAMATEPPASFARASRREIKPAACLSSWRVFMQRLQRAMFERGSRLGPARPDQNPGTTLVLVFEYRACPRQLKEHLRIERVRRRGGLHFQREIPSMTIRFLFRIPSCPQYPTESPLLPPLL